MHELQYLALTKECIGKHTRTVVVKKIFFDKIFLLKKKTNKTKYIRATRAGRPLFWIYWHV